ncbi:MAG: dephospho-CoA kinase [Myxococcota bacterium]
MPDARPGSLVVGLTGGIGTGKTRVADLLAELGAAVECSDRIVRELQAPGGEVLRAIVGHFGPEVLTPEGELDRPRLGARVFRDPEARRALGELIHPAVYRQLARRAEEHRKRGVPVIVLDIPLLLEGRASGRGSGAKLPFDLVAVVWAPPAVQLERVMTRDGLPREQAQARIDAQMPIDEKVRMADVRIDNAGDWDATERRVRNLYRRWLGRAGR